MISPGAAGDNRPRSEVEVSVVEGGGGLSAGYGVVDITPPAGVDLTGFIARDGPCAGTLDPLEARALVVGDARGRRAALVTCDLIGLGRHLVARVRRRVAVAAGVPAAAQLYACSHTHAGPETGVLTTIGMPDGAYLEALEERLVAVVAGAARAMAPVRLGWAATEVSDGLVVNRVYRRVGRPNAVDRQLTVVRLERAASEEQGPIAAAAGAAGAAHAARAAPLAAIVAFACHAVALGAGERHASADYVAPLRRALEAAGAGPVLYVNGCGGDVNPASMDARGREACDALGHGLAAAALVAWRRATPAIEPASSRSPALGQSGDERRPPPSMMGPATSSAPPPANHERVDWTIAAAQELVALPFQPLRSAAAAAAILAAGRERLAAAVPASPAARETRVTDVEYPLRLLRLHHGNEELPEVRAEVQALRVGPLSIVAMPGEIFSSLGRRIKAASPFAAPRTLIAGWANDNVGYVPDRDAYPLGGYEVDTASRYYGYPAGWAPEAGDALVDAALRLLRRLAASDD